MWKLDSLSFSQTDAGVSSSEEESVPGERAVNFGGVKGAALAVK